MNRPEDLTPNVLNHLLKFAETRGRFWRRKLRDYWHTGVTSGFLDQDEAAALRAVRNSLAHKLNSLSVEQMEEWRDEDLYRQAAWDNFHSGGKCEIDGGARVSLSGSEGAYVQAWIWVPASCLGAA